MEKEKKWTKHEIIYGCISALIIILFLCLPILHIDTIRDDFNINGFKILAGSYDKLPSPTDENVLITTIVLKTSAANFLAILMPIGGFLFYKIVSSKPAKRFASFICNAIGLVYITLIPVFAFYWRNLNYGNIDITKIWGWFVVVIIYLAYVVILFIDLVKIIKKEKKNYQEKR